MQRPRTAWSPSRRAIAAASARLWRSLDPKLCAGVATGPRRWPSYVSARRGGVLIAVSAASIAWVPRRNCLAPAPAVALLLQQRGVAGAPGGNAAFSRPSSWQPGRGVGLRGVERGRDPGLELIAPLLALRFCLHKGSLSESTPRFGPSRTTDQQGPRSSSIYIYIYIYIYI